MLLRLPQAWIIFDKWLHSNLNVFLFRDAVFPNIHLSCKASLLDLSSRLFSELSFSCRMRLTQSTCDPRQIQEVWYSLCMWASPLNTQFYFLFSLCMRTSTRRDPAAVWCLAFGSKVTRWRNAWLWCDMMASGFSVWGSQPQNPPVFTTHTQP